MSYEETSKEDFREQMLSDQAEEEWNRKEEWNHERAMRTDWSYFCRHTDYDDIVERLEAFKRQTETYDLDFRHVMEMLFEDV
jgi:hypothetical protein